MSKPLKEDYIIRIKSRIEQRLDEPAAEEEKEEFVELMTSENFFLLLTQLTDTLHYLKISCHHCKWFRRAAFSLS